MFDEKQKEAYQSIKAPEALKKRIEATAKANEKSFSEKKKYLTACAACVVFMLAVLVFGVLGSSSLEISCKRSPVTKDGVVVIANDAVMSARAAEPVGIELEIQLRETGYLFVSAGEIGVYDAETGKQLSEAASSARLQFKGKVLVIWTGFEENSELQVQADGKKGAFVLEREERGLVIKKKTQ